MIYQKLHRIISEYVKLIQRFADRFWFPPLIGLLSALDNFLIIIPNEGILISSSMVMPKRWFLFALSVTVGSTIGALAFGALVEVQGLPWILEYYPGINETRAWLLTDEFFEKYGLYLIFAVGITPLSQHPAIILASLANTPLAKFAVALFFGRFIKFFIIAYIATHAPLFLSKMWGIQNELKALGLEIKKDE